jgi:hypothetical protein
MATDTASSAPPTVDYHRGRIVRLRSDISQRAGLFAAERGVTLPDLVAEALADYLGRDAGVAVGEPQLPL